MARKHRKQKVDPRLIRRGVFINLAISAALVSLLMLFLYLIMDSRTFQIGGNLVNRVETKEKVVALTFDDGPYPRNTERLMKILKEEDVKATFFLLGIEIERWPAQARLIAKEGHVIGNHTYQHAHMAFLSPHTVEQELVKTDQLIQASGAPKPSIFRPPYGRKMVLLPYYVNKMGMTTIMWDVAPDDEHWGNSELIVKYAREHVRPGSIIVLHAMYDRDKGTMNAVAPLIKSLRSDGYRFVTVPELLELRK